MAESFLAKITPVTGPGGGPVDPDFGIEAPVDPGYGRPVLPPLPGLWPPRGQVTPPIHYPPVWAMPPIFIDATPELPIALPPGMYPPLPPEIGGGPIIPPSPGGPGGPGGGSKAAILVMVVGLAKGDVWKGYRWYIYEKPPDVISGPPSAGPKR